LRCTDIWNEHGDVMFGTFTPPTTNVSQPGSHANAFSMSCILLSISSNWCRSSTDLRNVEDQLGSADLSILHVSFALGSRTTVLTSNSLRPGRTESIPDLTLVGFGLIPYSETNLGMMGTKLWNHSSAFLSAGTVCFGKNSNACDQHWHHYSKVWEGTHVTTNDV